MSVNKRARARSRDLDVSEIAEQATRPLMGKIEDQERSIERLVKINEGLREENTKMQERIGKMVSAHNNRAAIALDMLVDAVTEVRQKNATITELYREIDRLRKGGA